jgi:hypothetical protein
MSHCEKLHRAAIDKTWSINGKGKEAGPPPIQRSLFPCATKQSITKEFHVMQDTHIVYITKE